MRFVILLSVMLYTDAAYPDFKFGEEGIEIMAMILLILAVADIIELALGKR